MRLTAGPGNKDDSDLPGKVMEAVVEQMRAGARRPIELRNALLDVQTNNPKLLRAVGLLLLAGLISSFLFDL